jgi:hypothetical protein
MKRQFLEYYLKFELLKTSNLKKHLNNGRTHFIEHKLAQVKINLKKNCNYLLTKTRHR